VKPRYCQTLSFNQKSFKLFITINAPKDLEGYHYDMEIQTQERITGNEFCALKRYLENEGYIDEAVEYYGF
jgi:hypothetical protein